MKMIRIALCDDSAMFRRILMRVLDEEPDFEVVIEAKNGLDLLDRLGKTKVDIILLDIQMPRMEGKETVCAIKERFSQLQIITSSQYDSDANIIEMNIFGVKSFISKNDNVEELFRAIRVVHAGGIYVTANMGNIIQAHLYSQTIPQLISNKEALANDQGDTITQLSEREKEVLYLICQGLSSTDIGKIIFKSHRTVEKYRNDLYLKLDVTNKKSLIKMATHIIFSR